MSDHHISHTLIDHMGWRAVARFVREQQPTTTTPHTSSDGRHVSSLRWPSVRARLLQAVYGNERPRLFSLFDGFDFDDGARNLFLRVVANSVAFNTPLMVKAPGVQLWLSPLLWSNKVDWTSWYGCDVLFLAGSRLLCVELRRVCMQVLGHLVRQNQV